jgi:SPP1 family predicted phage head-tail adaptor
MRLGDLRHRLRLERPTEGALDSHGQLPEGWEAVGYLWAKIEPLSGRELDLARQQEARTTHRVTVRHNRAIGTRMRLVRGEGDTSRVLQIVSVLDVEEAHDVMQLLAVEVAA